MPDGRRTDRMGWCARCLFIAAGLLAIGLFVFAVWHATTEQIIPERGSAGPVTANSPNRNPPSKVRSRPQQ